MLALVGPWVLNKGDDLMLRSVLEHFRGTPLGAPVELWKETGPPDALIPLSRRPGTAEFAHALRHPARIPSTVAKGALLSLPPGPALRMTGRVGAHHVAGLMDCSGFAYGDTWTTRRMLRRHAYYAALRERGNRIVLLPQALGPFENPDMREAAQALFGLCDLVYARDADSFHYLKGLGLGPHVALRQCPDITHLLPGTPPRDPDAWRRRVCIVPNMRMVDRTAQDRAAAYLDFLVETVALTRSLDLEPWIVLHERNDDGLVRSLNDRLELPLPVIDENSLTTKGILGCCHAVIGSRYHALVSSLSQATPVIGTSWAHKYDRLFEEYGHDAFLLPAEVDQYGSFTRSILERGRPRLD